MAYLFSPEPHTRVGLPVIEVKPQLFRVVRVQVEALVSVRRAAGLDLAVVATVVVHVERPAVLGALIEEGDTHLDDVLRLAKEVIDPAPLVIIIEDVPLARPASVARAMFFTSVFPEYTRPGYSQDIKPSRRIQRQPRPRLSCRACQLERQRACRRMMDGIKVLP